MPGHNHRVDAISRIVNQCPTTDQFDASASSSFDLFGLNVFNDEKMQARLPKAVYKSLRKTIDTGAPLDPSTADAVAAAMQAWAIENGATHYAHVFYPLTGFTAEKRDSFIVPDGKGNAIAEFSGKALVQGEPDASSFPSGGIRETFEARGYTAWDVTSPAYLMETPNGCTLSIPTAFVSWTGEALDKKTPVLRSRQALNVQAQRILRLFGHADPGFCTSTAGAEQEYFLIDRNLYYLRPDLQLAGRTLVGAPPAKGQEFDDHYFGAIPDRVTACMLETERELYKLGIPIKTRHNEVAPGQYETAPVFEECNIATDHQQLVMLMLKKVARKYGFECVMHEKPFAGVNGSGKHVNFSLASSNVGNLLDAGDNPHDNAQFLVFCAAVIQAVYKHSKLLRAVVASAGNDHRLGANEAPPAILSIFLGEQLQAVFEGFKSGGKAGKGAKGAGKLKIGVDTLPELPRDAGDRNRTSPFAFIGNRFEFRAVGSNQSIAGPLVALNTAIADSLCDIADQIEAEVGKATPPDEKKLNAAVEKVLKQIAKDTAPVIFEGDGYSDAWHKEAEKRGLPNLKTTIDALPVITDPDVVAMFKKHKVLSKRELDSRREIYFEHYAKSVQVEARLTLRIARTMIFPAAIRYQSELATSLANLQVVDINPDRKTLDSVTSLIAQLQDFTMELAAMVDKLPGNVEKQAAFCCNSILPKMLEIREVADQLEYFVADDLWPLPKYQEMLFIR